MTRQIRTSPGMSRRHFIEHLAAASVLAPTAIHFTTALEVHAAELDKRHKAAILLWMGGGPSTIDIWDLKPGSPTAGPFQPIATSGEVQICEHLPMLAKQMHHLAVIRSMSTKEADHGRGRYFMHTGYVPDPNVTHPSYGSVVSYELADETTQLDVPPFISIGGASEGAGFLGMTYAPFVVDSNGRIQNLQSNLDQQRLRQRMQMLRTIEKGFIDQRRGLPADDHAKILDKTLQLMNSRQLAAFRWREEPQSVRDRYGDTPFGRGCLMARRLVEAGVPFVEVDYGGWDNHQNVFRTLKDDKLPTLDRAMSALVNDLHQRGLLEDTAVIWMGEFGRTPRINANAGRDHWARSWSAVVGGCGMRGGIAVGATSEDGTEVTTDDYSAPDLMASVLHALGIPLNRVYQSRRGQQIPIANRGQEIGGLFG